MTNLTKSSSARARFLRGLLLSVPLLAVTLLFTNLVAGSDGGLSTERQISSQPVQLTLAADPTAVSVGLLVVSVGKLDLQTGSYTVDFYLTLDCNRLCDPSRFEFVNGRATSKDAQDAGDTFRVFRILAALNQNLDLSRYPFDRHKLEIILEDSQADNAELVYKVNEKGTGISPDVLITGWDLDRNWSANVRDIYYPQFDQTYSRYVLTLNISRAPLNAVLKTLFPAFIVALVGLLSLFLGADKAMQRLGMLTAALGSAVILHLNLTQSLPPIGYLTYADGFMLTNYVLLAACLALTVRMVWSIDRLTKELGDEKLAAAELVGTNLLLQRAIPLAWVGMQAVTAFLFLGR